MTILVPEAGNLQLIAFWAALGAGYFADEGLDVQLVSPEKPALAGGLFQSGAAPVALLPGPSYERLVSDRFPFLLAANLLANDPLQLVIRRDVAERMHLSRAMPLRQRLDLMRGLRIGVSPQAHAHLNVLFRTQGLDADIARIIQMRSEEEIGAFGSNQVDGLYTQTPQVETALLDRDGVVLVDQAAGDVPAFSGRMIQAVAVSRAFAEARPSDVLGLAHAVARGEALLHSDKEASVDAILRALPKADRERVSFLLTIYGPAVPLTPHVEARLITREAAFYPAGGDRLSLAGIELASYVFDDGGVSILGAREPSDGSWPRRVLVLAGALALLIALLVVAADQRDRSTELG